MKFNTVNACEEGAWIDIKDFDGMKTDFSIKVLGIDSKKFKAEINRLTKANENNKVQDMDKLELSTIRTLVGITIDWEGAEDEEGNKIPFTKEMADVVYTNSPHVSQQVIEFAKDRTNFLD